MGGGKGEGNCGGLTRDQYASCTRPARQEKGLKAVASTFGKKKTKKEGGGEVSILSLISYLRGVRKKKEEREGSGKPIFSSLLYASPENSRKTSRRRGKSSPSLPSSGEKNPEKKEGKEATCLRRNISHLH